MHKKLSLFLGFMIFMFGFLKFFDPFKTWYAVQIQTSGLPEISYYSGLIGEMIIGALLISGPLQKNDKIKFNLLAIGSLGLITVMFVATYVHLLPQVPAEVLPMKIKPPIIPIVFLMMAAFNFYLTLALKNSPRSDKNQRNNLFR